MHGRSNTRIAALAVLAVCINPLVAANITLDNYSLLTPAAPSWVPTYVQEATVAGIASVSVQPDGETVYAETVVASLLAIVNGTSTLTTLVSAPTTLVQTFAEDASRASELVVTTETVSGPGSNQVFSLSDQDVCTGAIGAPATCTEVDVESVTGVAFTITVAYPAVRTPLYTITSSGSRAVGRHALAMALAVGVVRALVKSI